MKSKSAIKAVLFDLNGVLIKGDYPNWKEVRFISTILGVKLKKSFPLEWRKIYLPLSAGKMSLKQYNSKIEQLFGKKLPADFEEQFASCEKPKEKGIPMLLEKLKSKGYKIGVLTNSYHEWSYGALQKIGAWQYIDAIAVSSEIKARKPLKKAYEIALSRLKCKPQECIYVGDSQDDLDGAKKAGMQTLFIPDKEINVKGHHKINKLADILRLLE